MRTKILFVAFLCGPWFPLAVSAKGRQPPSPVQTPIEKRNERLMQLINVNIILTDEQKKAVRAALDNQNHASSKITRRYQSEQKALAEDTDKAIESVLNDEQKVTYARAKEALENEEAKTARRQQRLQAAGDRSEAASRAP